MARTLNNHRRPPNLQLWYCQRECSPIPVTHESFCSPRPSASASPHTVYILCRVPNSVSSPDPLTCGYSSCLTPCHRVFVSNSCHFFRSPRTFSTAVHTAVRIGAMQRLGCEPLCHGDERGPTPSLPASTSKDSAREESDGSADANKPAPRSPRPGGAPPTSRE